MLLANHGPVVSGASLEAAVYAIEELEETAKLFLLLKGQDVSPLDEPKIKRAGGSVQVAIRMRGGTYGQIRSKSIDDVQ